MSSPASFDRVQPPPVPGGAIVTLAALLVPTAVRRLWRDEWHAELGWAWDHPSSDLPSVLRWFGLVLRALGAIPDALEMRCTHAGDIMLGHDLRLALRTLVRRPGYAALVVFTLALGIGATTAVFTIADTVLLRPFPFRDVDRLVELQLRMEGGFTRPYVDPAVLHEWESQHGLLETVARFGNRSVVLEEGEPVDLRATTTSPEFFQLLGVSPRMGRVISADDVTRAERVAVVSDALWRGSLGADPDVVGRSVQLSGERYTVIGVMPPTFRYPMGRVSLWVPLPRDTSGAGSDLQAIARLAPGVTLGAAQSRADAISAQLAAERPDSPALQLPPVGEWRAQPEIRRGLMVLAGAVGCVLLIACANAANLLLIRATASQRDLTVRLALGATRGRVVRELLTEAALLAAAGGALGVLFAQAGLQAITPIIPSDLTYWTYAPLSLDLRVLAFSVALSVATVLFFGLLPAVQATRRRQALASGGRNDTGTREQRRMRGALVVGQLALSVMLLVGAGLLIHSFARLSSVNPGMDVDRLALLHISPSPERYPTIEQRAPFYQQVAERIRALPGVEAVSLVSGVAGGAGGLHFGTALEVEGAGAPRGGDPEILPMGEADTSYFRTLGIPIVQGRAFAAEDLVRGSETVIIDVDLAHHLWPDGNAVGGRFRTDATSPWLTVVGVSGDVKLWGPDDRAQRFEIYYPARFGLGGQRTIAVRTSGDPAALLPFLKAAVHEVDPLQPVVGALTAAEQYRVPLSKPRFLLALMAVFAGVAALLAGVGLYGVIAYTVTQRTREIGVRMALGAHRGRIMRDVVREGAALTALGIVIGIGASLGLGRYFAAVLFEVEPADPLTLGAVVTGLGLVALLAAIVPARRASRVDPVLAMRGE